MVSLYDDKHCVEGGLFLSSTVHVERRVGSVVVEDRGGFWILALPPHTRQKRLDPGFTSTGFVGVNKLVGSLLRNPPQLNLR